MDYATTIHTQADVLMKALLAPKSIALVGASEQEGSVGHEVLRNLIAGGYRGEIHPVNPKYCGQSVFGHHDATTITPYTDTVQNLPAHQIDMAMIMTPNHTVPGILEKLGEIGVRAVVVVSAGFQEIGPEGQALAEQLNDIVQQYHMMLVGPNCLGIANMHPDVRMNATFARTAPLSGKGALFSQSGAVGIDLINRTRRLGIGLSQFISLGNELNVHPSQLLRHWQHDPKVDYILGYLESGRALQEIRELAADISKTKPILLIKAGKSDAGARAARSHTGAMAGSEEAVQALIAQTGLQRFDSIRGLMAAAQAIESSPPAMGNRIAILSNAGGYAVMTSDRLSPRFQKNHGLVLAEFSPDTEAQLAQLLPNTASHQNPIDTTATYPGDSPERFKKTLETIAQDPQVDACLVEIIEIMGIQTRQLAPDIAAIQQQYQKPIILVGSIEEEGLEAIKLDMKTNGTPSIAIYSSIENAVIGLGALVQQQRWNTRPKDMPVELDGFNHPQIQAIFHQARQEHRTLLSTSESLEVLRACGISIPKYQIAQTLEEGIQASQQIGFPLVIKLNSKTISHKTDVGGVQVDIRTPEEFQSAFETMLKKLREAGIHSFSQGEGIMVQAFYTQGRELILGVNEEADFGKLLMMGRGGIYAQVDQDVQFRLNPVTPLDIREMIQQIKAYKILQGYRGKPGIDLETLENTMLRLSELTQRYPEIQELDINPYLALPKESPYPVSGVAVDSRIILKEK